jgi:thioesterase domain-containing protein
LNGPALIAGFGQTLGISWDDSDNSWDAVDLPNPGLEEQLSRILQHARKLNLLPPDVNEPHLNNLFRIFKANVDALFNYRPRPVACSLRLLKASEGATKEHQDQTLGWRSLVPDVEVRVVPGDHYTILKGTGLSHLAEHLNEWFNQ